MTDGTCSIDGCGEAIYAKAFCSLHYFRNRYHGDPTAGGIRRVVGDTKRRYRSRVDAGDPDECWLWSASVGKDGYARFWDSESQALISAHRYGYELASGKPIPDGMTVDHVCHNLSGCSLTGRDCPHRRCQNPSHLELVTRAENIRRGRANRWQSEKSACKRGHAFSEANTGRDGRGKRYCKECRRIRQNERRAAARA